MSFKGWPSESKMHGLVESPFHALEIGLTKAGLRLNYVWPGDLNPANLHDVWANMRDYINGFNLDVFGTPSFEGIPGAGGIILRGYDPVGNVAVGPSALIPFDAEIIGYLSGGRRLGLGELSTGFGWVQTMFDQASGLNSTEIVMQVMQVDGSNDPFQFFSHYVNRQVFCQLPFNTGAALPWIGPTFPSLGYVQDSPHTISTTMTVFPGTVSWIARPPVIFGLVYTTIVDSVITIHTDQREWVTVTSLAGNVLTMIRNQPAPPLQPAGSSQDITAWVGDFANGSGYSADPLVFTPSFQHNTVDQINYGLKFQYLPPTSDPPISTTPVSSGVIQCKVPSVDWPLASPYNTWPPSDPYSYNGWNAGIMNLDSLT